MDECKHELKDLVGVADGIICTRCGKKFASWAELSAEDAPKPVKKAVRRRGKVDA